jgi:hypothetical protein
MLLLLPALSFCALPRRLQQCLLMPLHNEPKIPVLLVAVVLLVADLVLPL